MWLGRESNLQTLEIPESNASELVNLRRDPKSLNATKVDRMSVSSPVIRVCG